MDIPVEYTRGQLNKLDPCCANCEFIGAVSTGCKAACQLTGDLTEYDADNCKVEYDIMTHVCPDWEINMDIDETDGSQDDDVILYG